MNPHPTPLPTILHEALFVVYRNMVVSRLRDVLTADEVASASRAEVREEQIAHHEMVAPIQDVYSVVDLASANNLLNHYARRLLPPAQGRAAQELLETEFRRDLKKIRLWRDPVAHPTESNRPRGQDALESVEAAQRVLARLGLDSDALNRFVRLIRASDPAATKAHKAERTYGLPPKIRLYGRDRDLGELRSLLTDGATNLITVTGPGGAGKTSIAIEAVRNIAHEGSRPVRFIPLESATLEGQVLAQLRGAVGLPMQSGGEDALIAQLRATPSILLLDNVEQALAASALIGSVATKCEQSLLIITSRERLGVKREQVFSLPTLAVPAEDDSIGDMKVNPAVQVFVERLQAGRGKQPLSDSEYRDIAAIVRQLDGLCLAIELVAAQSIDRNIAKVRNQIPQLLAEPVPDPTMPERHRTLIACLKWSWDLTSREEQALLKRISVVFGEFGVSTIDRMCNDLGFKSNEDIAARAVRRNLLKRSTHGYSLLEPIRQFILIQMTIPEQRLTLAAILQLATEITSSVQLTETPKAEDLLQAFRIGSNALVLLEHFEALIDRDHALECLLSWCPLSWRYDETFGRWDDELVLMLTKYSHPRRGAPSKLVAKSLIELARLQAHYERLGELRALGRTALSEALAIDDAGLASSAIAVFLLATVESHQARRRLMARLIRYEWTEALIAAVSALAIPGQFGSFGDIEDPRDFGLSVTGLHAIAAAYIARDDREAAGLTLFHSQLLIENWGGRQRLWRRQAELAGQIGASGTLQAALVGIVCTRLGLPVEAWEALVFDVTGREATLPKVQSSDGVLTHVVIQWPRGGTLGELYALIDQANSLGATFQTAALLAAFAIRKGDLNTFDTCLDEIAGPHVDPDRGPLVLAAFAVWSTKNYTVNSSVRLMGRLIAWLASHGNQMAAFALRSRLAEIGIVLPNRRWRLAPSEKSASIKAVEGLTLDGIAAYAEAEVTRVMRRDAAKRRFELGIR